MKAGTNRLEFVGLPSDLSPETIDVSSSGDLDILSIKSKIVYTYKKYDDPQHITLQYSIQDLHDSISLIDPKNEVLIVD